MRGSVYKRGSTWEYKLDAGKDPQTGKRKQKTKGGFKTKKECQAAMAELINSLEKGTYFEAKQMLLKDYLQYWLANYSKVNLAPSSHKRYTELCATISKHIGCMNIAELKPMHIQKFYSTLIEEGKLSNSTIAKIHKVFNLAMKHAIDWGMINISPVTRAKPPKGEKKEMNVWDIDTANLFLEQIGEKIYLPVLLALDSGMRLGEICGLKWEDINTTTRQLTIKRSLQKIKKELIIKAPKTSSSLRTIDLMSRTVTELKKVKKRHAKLQLKNGTKYEYVCCWEEDGRPMLPNYVTKNFIDAVKKLDFPKIRFHDLRHTHATMLLQQGINPKIVSERLGHANISITLDTYSHVLPNMQKEAVRQLENLITNSKMKNKDKEKIKK